MLLQCENLLLNVRNGMITDVLFILSKVTTCGPRRLAIKPAIKADSKEQSQLLTSHGSRSLIHLGRC